MRGNMTIHYIENGALLDVRTNMKIAPTPGKIIEINGYLHKVKAVVWHLESTGTWVEVLL